MANADLKENAIIKIQNAIRNKKAIDTFSTEYANKIIQEKKMMSQNKQNAATQIQNAIRNKKAIDEFSTEYANKVIQERNIMNDANDMVSQINKNRMAATRIQNAIRNKNAIKKVASTRANNIIEEEKNKERQKEVFRQYSAMYKPNEDLTLKVQKIKKIEPKFSFEDERRRRQARVFEKTNIIYQPQYSLRYVPL